MIAWHYTTGEKFIQIVESGRLRPTDSYINKRERPVLWFSLDQRWEQTANKGWLENGVARWLCMEETRAKGRGLFRFGLEARCLTPWPKLGRDARMTATVIQQLSDGGRRRGADPKQWCGTLKSVEVANLIVCIMNDRFEWEVLQAAQLRSTEQA